MKTTHVGRLATVSVLWLALGAGCHKDPPKPGPEVAHSCNDGTCCMQDTIYYEYVEQIENQPADLLGSTLTFKEPMPLSNAAEWFNPANGAKYKSNQVIVCVFTRSRLAGLPNTTPITPKSWADFSFHYRVWGKIYWDKWAHTLLAIPILYVYVDRIEEVK